MSNNQSKSLESVARQKLEALKAFIKHYKEKYGKEPSIQEIQEFLTIIDEKSFVVEGERVFTEAEIEAMEKEGGELISKLCKRYGINSKHIRLVIDPGSVYDAKIIAGNPAIIFTSLNPKSRKFNEVIRDLFRSGHVKKAIHNVSLVSTSKLADWDAENRKLLLQSRDIRNNEEFERIFGAGRKLISKDRLSVEVETKVTVIDEETGLVFSVSSKSPRSLYYNHEQSSLAQEARIKLSALIERMENEPIKDSGNED